MTGRIGKWIRAPFSGRLTSEHSPGIRAGRRTACFAAGAIVLCASAALAASEDTGRFSAAFLRIPVGARAMALPGVVAATRPDASLFFANPAVVADMETGQLFFSAANWLDDLSLSAANVVLPISPYDLRLSFGSRLLYSGDLKGYNAADQVVAEDRFYDLALSGGISKRFDSVGLALGADVTYIREHLPAETGNGVTLSIGASYRLANHRVDAAVKDIGGGLDYPSRTYPIDNQYTLGYAYQILQQWGQLMLGGEFTVSQSDYRRFQVGAEYAVSPFLTLRTGVDHFFRGAADGQSPVTAGLGLHYGSFSLDYAYASQEFFANTHTFSVAFSFGSPLASRQEDGTPPAVGATTGDSSGEAAVAPRVEPQPAEASIEPKPVAITAAPVGANAADGGAEAGDETAVELVPHLLVAGIHDSWENARVAVRKLRLSDVPAIAEPWNGQFRIVVGRFESRQSAAAAAKEYEMAGHSFTIVADTP